MTRTEVMKKLESLGSENACLMLARHGAGRR